MDKTMPLLETWHSSLHGGAVSQPAGYGATITAVADRCGQGNPGHERAGGRRLRTLAKLARRLKIPGLPPLILMTDGRRLPDPAAAVAGLPRGSAVIARHRDGRGLEALARSLAGPCRRRGVRLLVSGNGRLAWSVGADGLHLPEAMARRGPIRRRPGWLVTAAAHSPAALARAAAAGADAALLSPVFATAGHPGALPLGPLLFAAWCRDSPLPVYALGGINSGTARRLMGANPAGFAGIGGPAGL